jgi:hypothetical protein
MKAKVKQQYAKVLKEEGMESTRLSTRGEGEAGRVRTLEKGKGKGKSRAVGEGEEDDDGDSSDDGGITISRHPKPSSPPPRTIPPTRNARDKRPKSKVEVEKSSTVPLVRALSPSRLDIGPPLPQTSLRELKKEAFSKYHAPPRSRTSGYGTTPRGRVGGFGMGMGTGTGKRGQPNMGARMGALLEQIKRDKQV